MAADDFARFVNGASGDIGIAPSEEALVDRWVLENAERPSLDPSTWKMPDRKSSPGADKILAAWNEDRERNAIENLNTYIEGVRVANSRRHSLAQAESQIAETIETERMAARKSTSIEIKR